jgi:hypothetical protein
MIDAVLNPCANKAFRSVHVVPRRVEVF